MKRIISKIKQLLAKPKYEYYMVEGYSTTSKLGIEILKIEGWSVEFELKLKQTDKHQRTITIMKRRIK